ncbi:MAG: hypothetical protein DBY37_04735 [Desulfovibrionaceae bacterium]|nr:MAG: hypothetical protein DBY37_04735 [Desulfovibrionaceae bacterium]
MRARLFIQREKHVSPHCGLQAVLLRNPAGKCFNRHFPDENVTPRMVMRHPGGKGRTVWDGAA